SSAPSTTIRPASSLVAVSRPASMALRTVSEETPRRDAASATRRCDMESSIASHMPPCVACSGAPSDAQGHVLLAPLLHQRRQALLEERQLRDQAQARHGLDPAGGV